ncbi:GDSL-type esterase/lipase family protein [Sorangium sp. So ce1097]|uniref:GDSL-type esterase/lipase family protein n=1 Tax=Sorangium sp. So ce1097 TaxID=3133330 RepID=UPI003F5E76D6
MTSTRSTSAHEASAREAHEASAREAHEASAREAHEASAHEARDSKPARRVSAHAPPGGGDVPPAADPADDARASATSPPRNGLASSAAAALATLALLVLVPYAHPSLWRLRLLTPLPEGEGLVVVPAPAPAASVGETALVVETTEQAELRQPEEVALPAAAAEIVPAAVALEGKPPRPIEDPSGEAMTPFFRALAAVERKAPGSIARISYFGDSIVASDFVTATLRRKLQKRFGDAGHGFMLMANAWPGYFHNDVVRYATKGWQVSRVVGPYAKDGLYGLGGVSFRSEYPGVLSRFATAETGTFGRAVSRFAVDYLKHPEGGRMEIKIDGETREVIDTRADETASAIATYDVPDGPHALEVWARGPGVRAFGVWMERDTPGVVLDAIGIQGARIRFLDKSDDAHFAEQLRARSPSLTVFQYGMNESEDGELFPLDQVESTMKAVLDQVRAALPGSSCLLVGPMDRADKKGEVYRSRPVIPKLAAIQRRVAEQVGCGYFDTFGAMGGSGSMGIWARRGLGGADLAHPSGAGAEVIGRWLYLALMEAYEGWKASASAAQP